MSTEEHERTYRGTALARLEFESGARSSPPRDRYVGLARFGDEAPQYSLTAEFLNPLDESRWETLARVDFLVDAAPHEQLVRGQEFELLEGDTVVARGTVLVTSKRVSDSPVRDSDVDSGTPRHREAA